MVSKGVLVDAAAFDAVEIALAGQLVVDHITRLKGGGGGGGIETRRWERNVKGS
jgi:hypothetical protein